MKLKQSDFLLLLAILKNKDIFPSNILPLSEAKRNLVQKIESRFTFVDSLHISSFLRRPFFISRDILIYVAKFKKKNYICLSEISGILSSGKLCFKNCKISLKLSSFHLQLQSHDFSCTLRLWLTNAFSCIFKRSGHRLKVIVKLRGVTYAFKLISILKIRNLTKNRTDNKCNKYFYQMINDFLEPRGPFTMF